MPAKFNSARDALMFIRGGNATVTLRSAKTGVRYTYRVRETSTPGVYFVSFLSGADNENDYTYLGLIGNDQKFRTTNKTHNMRESAQFKAFRWTLNHLNAGSLPDQLEAWHEGRCGRCNRKLTVPESVESGFGPECAEQRARLWSCVAA